MNLLAERKPVHVVLRHRMQRFFDCPECGKHEFSVEHLFEMMETYKTTQKEAGPWFCDNCGQSWWMTVFKEGGIEVKPGKQRKIRQLAELEIPPLPYPITLHVETARYESLHEAPLGREDPDGHQYYFEEHTCPGNYLRATREIIVDGDNDMHGLAKYKGIVREFEPGEDR